jgi:hypothetical protein
MKIEFSFKNDNKELSLKEAKKGDVVIPAVSAQAVSGIEKVLNALRESNQNLAQAIEKIRTSESFTATLEPQSSDYFKLNIRGNAIGITITKLSQKTAEGLLSSTKPRSEQPISIIDDEPEIVELPNRDFNNPTAIAEMEARRKAELLRKASESPDTPKVYKHPNELIPSAFKSVIKDPNYENTAKTFLLMPSDIDKPIQRQTTPLQSMPLARKKEMLKTLLTDLKAKDLDQEQKTLLDKISSDINQLLESDEPIAESLIDHILSCKTVLLESKDMKELQQLSKVLDLGLSRIRLQQLSRQSEALEKDFNTAIYLRDAPHTFTLREIDEYVKDLSEAHIKERYALYRNDFCQKDTRTYNSNLAKIEDLGDYFFRQTPRPVAVLKKKISALIGTFHATPHYQKWKDVNEAILKLLDLMEEGSTAGVWKQAILMPQVMYWGNRMKNLLEELSKQATDENLTRFQLLMEELFRSEMEELTLKTSKTPEESEALIRVLREKTPAVEGYSWISARSYKLLQENALLRDRVKNNQDMMDETSTLMKLFEDLKTLRNLRDSINYPSDLYQKLSELENQQYALPLRCFSQCKKAHVPENNAIVKKIESTQQDYLRLQKESPFADSQLRAEHLKYKDLLANY